MSSPLTESDLQRVRDDLTLGEITYGRIEDDHPRRDPRTTREWGQWLESGGWIRWYRTAYVTLDGQAELRDDEWRAYNAWRRQERRDRVRANAA
jgi:hypothetical protein